MNKHTPKPWVDCGTAICAAKGQSSEAYQLLPIVFLPHPDDWEKGEWKANVNLVSAAPDLLEACIEALSLFDNYPQCYEAFGTYQVLNNAIKKATQ